MRDPLRSDHVGINGHLPHRHRPQFLQLLHMEHQPQRPGRGGVEVAQRHPPRALVGARHRPGLHEGHARHRRVGQRHFDLHILRRERHQALDLAVEDRTHLVGRLDKPVVAAARPGHRLQQVLVEAGPEADAGGADPSACRGTDHRHQLGHLGDAFVGLAVGQQHHPVGALDQRPLHMLHPLEPASREIGAAAGPELPNCQPSRLSRRAAALARPEDGAHLVVKCHHGQPVLGRKERGEATRGVLRGRDRDTIHGTGTVQHQSHVDGRATCGRVAGDRHQHPDLVAVLGGGKAGGKSDLWLHGAPRSEGRY